VDFNLSTEEQRIVALIVAGYTNKDMAVHFSLSQSTIYRRTIRIIAKLGVCNKFELLLFAISHELLGGLPE
jgi:two-component system response regulator NreC